MAITDVKGRERAPLRWIALLLAATTLSGCVASALDSTISFAPDANSAYSGENDQMVTVPRPSEDLAEFAAEEAAGDTEEPVDALAAMPPENANPDPGQTEEILSPQTEMMAATTRFRPMIMSISCQMRRHAAPICGLHSTTSRLSHPNVRAM